VLALDKLEYLEIFSRLPGKSKFLRETRAKRIFPNIDRVLMMKASKRSCYSIEPQTQDSDNLTEKAKKAAKIAGFSRQFSPMSSN